jgi:hypothetical protein
MKDTIKHHIEFIKHPFQTEKQGFDLLSKQGKVDYCQELGSLFSINTLLYGVRGLVCCKEGNSNAVLLLLGVSSLCLFMSSRYAFLKNKVKSGEYDKPQLFHFDINLSSGESFCGADDENSPIVKDVKSLKKSFVKHTLAQTSVLALSAAALFCKFSGGDPVASIAMLATANEFLAIKTACKHNKEIILNSMRSRVFESCNL